MGSVRFLWALFGAGCMEMSMHLIEWPRYYEHPRWHVLVGLAALAFLVYGARKVERLTHG